MNPKQIAETLEIVQTLLGQWLRFRQFYLKGTSQEAITPQEEEEFRDVSSAIAQNIRKLGQHLDEKRYPFRKEEISSLLKSAISIANFRALPVPDQKHVYREWHISLVYLSRTVGAVKFLNEGYAPLEKKAGKKGGKGREAGGATKWVTIAVVVVLLVGGAIGGALFFGLI